MKLIRSGDSKTVNLDQVSNIGFDIGKNRIIFNLQYSINIFNKQTPDYVYFEYDNPLDMQEGVINLLKICGDDFFISSDSKQRLVAKRSISSINYIDGQKRIIFNLNYDITHPKDRNKLTSDFVFWTFTTTEKYDEDKKILSESTIKI